MTIVTCFATNTCPSCNNLVGIYWIGINDAGSTGTYQWGTTPYIAANYTRWGTSQPDHAGNGYFCSSGSCYGPCGMDHCGMVFAVGDPGGSNPYWNDAQCGAANAYVCGPAAYSFTVDNVSYRLVVYPPLS